MPVILLRRGQGTATAQVEFLSTIASVLRKA
jgi:hypothetical protein